MNRSLPLLATSIAAVLTLAACSRGSDATVEVRPIDGILASDVDVETDPSGTSARVVVTTEIPVVCAVVYGTDARFGSIATDDDMAGGAHRDHGPLLTGLEPDTEYRYVLQGSDADGNLYRSDIMTFRTPAATSSPLPGRNVAPDGEVVAVSSEFSDGFSAGRAFDGNPGTEWSSAGDGDDAWITLELPQPSRLVGVQWRTRQMSDGSSIVRTYTVTVDDGEPLGPFPADEPVTGLDVEGQRLRFDAHETTGGNTGAVDIEVYVADPS